MREPTPSRSARGRGRGVSGVGLGRLGVGLALLIVAAAVVAGRPGHAVAALASPRHAAGSAAALATGVPVGAVSNAAGSTAILDAGPAARSPSGMTEASRPDGMLGRWVVATLLLIVAAVWIALLAVVVRVRRAVGPAPTSG